MIKELKHLNPRTPIGKEFKKLVDSGDITHGHIYYLIFLLEVFEEDYSKQADDYIKQVESYIKTVIKGFLDRQ